MSPTLILLALAGVAITVLLQIRAVQINRRHDLSGSDRDVAAGAPVPARALRPGQAPRTVIRD